MPIDTETAQGPTNKSTVAQRHTYRFHAPHLHLQSVFGDDWFGVKAEAFARFFGTSSFLIAQTVIFKRCSTSVVFRSDPDDPGDPNSAVNHLRTDTISYIMS